MEPALKHRLIGAAVLSALAIIFLPMLIVGKDPNQTATRVPLKVPDAPGGNFETKELPLGAPASGVPDGGVVGMDTSHPASPAVPSPASAPADASSGSTASPAASPGDTAASGAQVAAPVSPAAIPTPAGMPPAAASSKSPAAVVPAVASGKSPTAVPVAASPASPATPTAPPASAAASPASVPPAPIPAASAGGHYVVSLGTYSNAGNAQALVTSLKAKQLPAYAETVTVAGKQATRVRIGPFPQRGDAEAARLKAQQARSDMPANVVALDAAAPAPEMPAPAPVASPASKPTSTTQAAAKLNATKPSTPPSPAASGKTPAATAAASTAGDKPTGPSPAAAGRGYAVQVSAFALEEQANALRDKLRGAGFVAYAEKVQAESGTRWRVRVGPEADRDAADRLRTELSTKMSLSGMVVAYP